MTSKGRLLAVLALALIAAIVSLVSTAAGDERPDDDVKIIELTTRTVQDADLDLGKTGPSVGDRFVFSDDVFRGDRRVGDLGGECTVTRLEPATVPEGQEPTSATINCVATLRLPRGQVTLQGLVTFSAGAGPSFPVAITGGTGAYRTAHGEATVTESADPNAASGLRLELIR